MKRPDILFLALLLAGCNRAEPRVIHTIAEPATGAFDPFELDPRDPLEPDFEFERALDDADGAAAPARDFEEHPPVALEDLYLEMWHGGDREAVHLMDVVRDCDARAVMRFGPTRRVRRSELDPPASWPLELRYRADDPRGLEAAELLREHLRTGCDAEVREAVLRTVSRSGLVLRPVATLEVAHANWRVPLVLVHGSVRP